MTTISKIKAIRLKALIRCRSRKGTQMATINIAYPGGLSN
jgi:hypothetical protein